MYICASSLKELTIYRYLPVYYKNQPQIIELLKTQRIVTQNSIISFTYTTVSTGRNKQP